MSFGLTDEKLFSKNYKQLTTAQKFYFKKFLLILAFTNVTTFQQPVIEI